MSTNQSTGACGQESYISNSIKTKQRLLEEERLLGPLSSPAAGLRFTHHGVGEPCGKRRLDSGEASAECRDACIWNTTEPLINS